MQWYLNPFFPQIGTPDSSATKRLSEPHQHLLPKRQTKPLAHLYNPHSRDYGGSKPEAGQGDNGGSPMRFTIQTYGDLENLNSVLCYYATQSKQYRLIHSAFTN